MDVGGPTCLVLLVLCCVAPSLVQTQSRIAFVGPGVFRPGSNYAGSLTNLATDRMFVTMSIVNNVTKTVVGQAATVSIPAGGLQEFTIQNIPYDLDDATKFVIRLSENLYKNETEIRLERKSRSIFITTDKSIYKPGAKVMFRTFALDVDLKNLKDPMDVEIYDPAGNKIKQWLSQTDPQGVISHELQLPSQTPLGLWKIKVTSMKENEQIDFQVDEYTLPRYDVDISFDPPFVVNSEVSPINLAVIVKAKYTIGTDVDGTLLLTVRSSNSFYNIPTKTFNRTISGVHNVDIKYTEGMFTRCRICQMIVDAQVQEKLTGEWRNATSTIMVYQSLAKLSFMEGPQFLKAGLKSRFLLEITQQDGSPLPNTGKNILVRITENSRYIQGRSNSPQVRELTLAVPANGIAIIEHVTSVNATSVNLQATYDGVDTYTNVGQTFKTRSNNSIEIEQITTKPGTIPYRELKSSSAVFCNFYIQSERRNILKTRMKNIQVNKVRSDVDKAQWKGEEFKHLIKVSSQLEFRIRGTEVLGRVYYQIISKKNIVASGSQLLTDVTGNVFLMASAAMAPRATILIFYISDGEMIAATESFEISFSLTNQMTLRWSADRKKVKESVNLEVTAEPNSYVAVAAVDQSVLLLGEANDITMDSVIQELEEYDREPKSPRYFGGGRPVFRKKRSFFYPGWFSASDTAKLLKATGLIYMTDAFVYSEPRGNVWYRREGGIVMFKANAVPEMADDVNLANERISADSGLSPSGEVTASVRKFFPESWIWMFGDASPDGRVSFNATVPDTITSWVATGFALHAQQGLGLPPKKANLTAFQPFFITVDKPYSLIRGEEVTIKVLVFNYLGADVDATVNLARSDQFMVKVTKADTAASKALSKTVRVMDNKGASVSFIVVPQTLGRIIMPLVATAPGARDSVEEPILVEPEGYEVEKNDPTFIDLSSSQAQDKSFTIIFPTNGLVAGSRSVTINVIGDLMGTTLTGLGRLIKMPYGCGEQNMLQLVPNIVVRKYLETTGKITSKQIADTTRFMEAGYVRELTYQRTEGSFSAFGNRDPKGSTWLTSFVINMFKEAEEFIFIDNAVLIKSLNWLLDNTRSRSGTFREVGNVIHKSMQGGSGNGDETAMTAYVLIALEECRELNASVPKLLDSIRLAREYLESRVAATTNVYNLAIMLYALQVTGSSSVNMVYDKLKAVETVENGMKYWPMPEEGKAADTKCRHCHRKMNNEVEMVSFVILTLVRQQDVASALPLTKYLMSVKNPRGGFFSTQDTVWGLKALAEFSALTISGPKSFTVDVTVGSNQRKQFTVSRQNAQVLQNQFLSDAELDGNTQQVQIDVSGQGTGLVEVSHRYHSTSPMVNPVVVVTVETIKPNENTMVFESCVKLLDSSVQDMFILELNDPTGFSVDTAGIKTPETVKRVEKDGKKNIVYLDTIPANVDQCITMRATKTNDVERIVAPVARVYGYYTGSESSVSVDIIQPVGPGVESSTSVSMDVTTTDGTSSLTSDLVLAIITVFVAGWITARI